MWGLPDSAVYGTYKRMKGASRRSTRRVSHGDDFWEFLYWVAYFVRWAKKRWK